MTHYICTGGCGGESATPGVCMNSGCMHHEKPLESCDCTDGKHFGKSGKESSDEEEKEEGKE